MWQKVTQCGRRHPRDSGRPVKDSLTPAASRGPTDVRASLEGAISGIHWLRRPRSTPSPEAVLHWVSWPRPVFLKIHTGAPPSMVSRPSIHTAGELVRKAHSQVVPRPAEPEVLGVSDSSAPLTVTEFENLCAVGRVSQSKGRKTHMPCALKGPLQTGVYEAVQALGLGCHTGVLVLMHLPCDFGHTPSPSPGPWIFTGKA